METYISVQAEQLVQDFSTFVADAGSTKFFAAKSAIVHIEKILLKYSNCITKSEIETLEKEKDYITSNYLR